MHRPHIATATRRTRKNERGAVLAAFVLSSAALFALTAVGIDSGRVALTANEVQTVADSAATAGAKALLEGKSAAVARSQAQTVVGQNRVNGSGGTINSAQIQIGRYNIQTRTFSNGATPANAARATPSVTVQNLFAGIFGSSYANTTVTKTATAAYTGLGRAKPTLPLAIGECNYHGSCSEPDDLPSLSQAPSGSDNSGWTSFTNGSASRSSVEQYMPSACGGSRTPPEIGIGQSVSLSNGQMTPLLKDVENCVKQGIKQFVVPIVSCSGNFNQTSTVTGFATIIVDSVKSTGGNQGIKLHAIFDEVVGPPGGGEFGTYTVRLFS